MKTKKFGDKRITIRLLHKSDLRKAKVFLEYTNELAQDGKAYILRKSKITLKKEKNFLKGHFNGLEFTWWQDMEKR